MLESGGAGHSEDLVVVDVDLLFQTAHLYNLYSNHIRLAYQNRFRSAMLSRSFVVLVGAFLDMLYSLRDI